ncbi:glycerate kinase [Halochromatium salexigens]|uniref:glycerate kinase n=1 Tax=Halochromatium salexigens TaxID=49447 RepID=UPI0019127B7D|nr:glycerate kinase [Halochromatium salexigens]
MPPRSPLTLVIAPNALKGSCSARAAAGALAAGVRRAAPEAEIRQVPVADGGDGLLEIACTSLGAEHCERRVTGPDFIPVEAAFAWLPGERTALIEMALASGLALLAPAERDPSATTTLGTGELMREALALGAETLFIGLGGSATNDGGIGMASALGYRFLDAQGRALRPVGAALAHIARIDSTGVDPRLSGVRIEAMCDVENPLTGATGAAATYAPQKGATPETVAVLEAGLRQLAERLRQDLGCEVDAVPGAGAAGGLGAGLMAFCAAALRPGAELVLDLVGLEGALEGADLVLTAEGRIDAQSASGKAPAAVAARARRHGIPCIGVGGSVGDEIGALHGLGLDAVFSLCPGPMELAEAERRVEELLAKTAEQVVRAFLAGPG